MSKLTKEQILARRKRMQEEALKSVAKTEQLNIRIDAECITRLYDLAGKRKTPVGAMVREWITEKIHEVEQPAYSGYTSSNQRVSGGLCKESDVTDYGTQGTSNVLQRLEALEKEVKRLSKRK